jgi:bifunctional non-homologous end joining protein LigD
MSVTSTGAATWREHDGFRFICRRDGVRVRVFSRRGNDYTDRVPAIVEALAALKLKSVTIDGEGVVCGSDGVSDFMRLSGVLGRRGSRRVFLYAFQDLRPRLWEDRRKALTKLLRKAGDGIRLSEHLAITDGNTIFRHACAMGLEGIVAKRRDQPYRSGRSSDWVKVKNPDAPAATRVIEG